MITRIHITKSMFSHTERVVAKAEGLKVSSFIYPTGIEALRVANERGEIIVLPFKGQQIWSATFDGRKLTMGSMFSQPVDTMNYLETYGAFFIHCGLTAIAAPSEGDDHPLHGELPNAPFTDCYIAFDSETRSVTIGGHFTYAKAFACHYVAHASVTLGRDATLMDVTLKVSNKKRTPMEVMYLAHANFRPMDNGELVYSAPYDGEHVRVRTSIPSHISPAPGYVEFVEQLASSPQLHHVLKPELAFDPEVVFTLDMKADEDGYAHAMHKHPTGACDYIRYAPNQAPMATRWICRTPDQQGLGMAFPATCGVEGYSAEKAQGHFVELEGGATWCCDIRLGALDASEAELLETHINSICAR